MTETVEGVVGKVVDRDSKDYFAIGLKREQGAAYHGNGSTDLQEGKKIVFEHDKGSIENIKRTGGNKGLNSGSRAGEASNSSSSSINGLSNRQASIHAQTATKLAVEHAEKSYNDDVGKYLDEVSERAQAYNNIMNQLHGENLE